MGLRLANSGGGDDGGTQFGHNGGQTHKVIEGLIRETGGGSCRGRTGECRPSHLDNSVFSAVQGGDVLWGVTEDTVDVRPEGR